MRDAAKTLQVNPSTVTRRLERMESRLGVLLFTRSPQGLTITAHGREVIARLASVDQQLAAVESELMGKNRQLEGALRIAVADVVAPLLPDLLQAFARQQPEVRVSVFPDGDAQLLTKGSLDVVIQATESPAESMVGRPLGSVALAAFATPEYFERGEGDADATTYNYIGGTPDEVHGQMMFEHCQQHVDQALAPITSPHLFMQHACIAAGLGFGMLPRYLGAEDERLVQLSHVPTLLSRPLWLLTHPDLRRVRRVVLFMEFIREAFLRDETRFSGGDT